MNKMIKGCLNETSLYGDEFTMDDVYVFLIPDNTNKYYCMTLDEVKGIMQYIPMQTVSESLQTNNPVANLTLFYNHPAHTKRYHELLFKEPYTNIFLDKSLVAYATKTRAFYMYKRGNFEIGSMFGVSNMHDVKSDVYSVYPVNIDILIENIDNIPAFKDAISRTIDAESELIRVENMIGESGESEIMPEYRDEYVELKQLTKTEHDRFISTFVKHSIIIENQHQFSRVNYQIPYFEDTVVDLISCQHCNMKEVNVPYTSAKMLTLVDCPSLITVDANKVKSMEVQNSFQLAVINGTTLKYLSLDNNEKERNQRNGIVLTEILLPTSLSCLNLRRWDILLSADLVNLTILRLNMTNIETIPKELVNLESIMIEEGQKLKSLPNTLVNLKHLSLINCPNITTIPITYSHLEYVSIINCSDEFVLPIKYLMSSLHFRLSNGDNEISRGLSTDKYDKGPEDYLNYIEETEENNFGFETANADDWGDLSVQVEDNDVWGEQDEDDEEKDDN